MAKDYYDILGIERSASRDDVKKAYKRLAKKYHPDLNKLPGAAEKFKELNEAAAVLGDPEKRSHYDQFGSAEEGSPGGFGRGFGGFDFSEFAGGTFDFDDIFESFFGGGRRRAREAEGVSLQYDLDIDLEDAINGNRKTIEMTRSETCGSCGGRTPFGIFSTSGPCRDCGGRGKRILQVCPTCDGTGLMRRERKLTVAIPKGADDGMRLRISGEGEAGPHGAPPGDLYIVLHIRPHSLFERRGHDLWMTRKIPFTTATLGGDIEVPTIGEPITLHLPAGTQPGTVFRIRNKGVPVLGGADRGSQHVKIDLEVPIKLTKRQRELLEEFDREGNKKGFFKL